MKRAKAWFGTKQKNVPAVFCHQALSQVDPKKVAECAKTHDEGPLRLISNQRQRHVPWLVQEQPLFDLLLLSFFFGLRAYFQFQAVCIFKEHVEQRVFVNLSQSVERMGMTRHVPCMTPRGEFYHMSEGRYLTGQGAQKKRSYVETCHVKVFFSLYACCTPFAHLPSRCGKDDLPKLPGAQIVSPVTVQARP